MTNNNLLKLGLNKHQNNKFEEAENYYKKFLKDNPRHPHCLYLIGTLYAQKKEFKKSIQYVSKSLTYDNKNADAYYNLGNVFQNLKKYNESIKNYILAINYNKKYLKAYLNLAHVYSLKKDFKKSIEVYLQILKIDDTFVDAMNNLGIVYAKIGEYKKGIKILDKAIKLNSKNARIHFNLGTIYQEIENFKKAINHFYLAIKIQPIHPTACNSLGYCYKQINEFYKAKNYYEKSMIQDPNYILAKLNYGNLLDMFCEPKKAIKIYNEAINIDPQKLSLRWALLNTLPTIYSNNEEIIEFTNHFNQQIKNLEIFIKNKKDFNNEEVLNGLMNSTNFYLHYQGINNVILQYKYANIIEQITKKIYPNISLNSRKKIKGKIKIGFVSPCFIEHSVSNTHKNFYLKLNKNIFDIYIYHINKEKDEYTDLVEKNVFSFFHNDKINTIINKLKNDTLNIIIFVDIGMDPKMQILASLRFAPIQINGNGQPVTSGFKNIDYVLTSELMEPANGNEHYSEKLIKLSGTGQCYENFIDNFKEKKIDTKKPIFFNMQNLIKLLPNEDEIYVDIIKNIPQCKIWFMKNRNTKITEIFISRLNNVFKKNNISFEKYIIMQKRRSQKEFFELINNSNIILDSLNWSGNNTSHQAITLGKPIITLPGLFMRSRHTYAILKKIEIEETIAKSRIDYVNIAKKLCLDNEYYKIVKKINHNKKLLFNDLRPIKELEEKLLKLVR